MDTPPHSRDAAGCPLRLSGRSESEITDATPVLLAVIAEFAQAGSWDLRTVYRAAPDGVNPKRCPADLGSAMLQLMVDRRWDGDERGDGVGDASQFTDGAYELIAAMQRPNWVAEQPELHLLPHLERACRSLPLRILGTRTLDDGSYDVQLGWTGEEAGVGAIRASIFALLGGIAEPSSYIRQRRTETNGSGVTLTFDVVTGIVDEVPFKPHGHALRLSVVAP